MIDFFKNKKFKDIVNLFFIITFLLASIWLIELIVDISVNEPHTLLNNGVFHHRIDDTFNDFYYVNDFFLRYSPYIECNSSYPPLNFIICFPFMLIQRHDKYPAFILYVITYSLFLIGIIILTVRKYKLSLSYTIKLVVALGISSPFMFMIERGNYIVLTFLFVCLFLLTYDSKNRVVRELSYVWLSIAAACKFYPAVFAILLLREKRYLDLAKTALYSLLLFFLPFLVMKEGFADNFLTFLNNLRSFSSYERLSLDVSTNNMVRIFAFIFGLNYLSSGVAIFSTIIKFSLFVLMVVGMIFASKKWQVLALASLCAVVIPSTAMVHVLVFLFPAIFMFLLDRQREKLDYFFVALFILIITPLQLGYIIKPIPFSEQVIDIQNINPNYLGLTVCTFIEAISAFALALTLSVRILFQTIKEFQNNQKTV